VATISGLAFTIIFFVTFEISEHLNRRKRAEAGTQELEKFRLDTADELTQATTSARPGNILVAARNPRQLEHLKRVLEKTDTSKIDIVVVTVKYTGAPGFGEHELSTDEVFSDDIAHLFSLVVTLAEKAGKHVELMVVPGRDPNRTLVETAQRIGSSLVIMGLSGKISAAEQAKIFGDTWETLPQPRPQLSLQLYDPATAKSLYFNLGPHPPRLWPQDLDLLHNLWLELSEKLLGPKLHHRDVVRLALRRLNREVHSGQADEILNEVKSELEESPPDGAV
jgi:nucleotide-binding universal stress UspA family protein